MDTLNVVIMGHADHGKSTFIGRLLYETGALSAEKVAKLNKPVDDDVEFELAHITDSFEEERSSGMTMEMSSVSFRYGNRQYEIIDVPGHYELLARVASGVSHADAVILIIDILEGLQRQTKLHCYMLYEKNAKPIIVLVNKVDLVNYDQIEFNKVRSAVTAFLSSINIPLHHVIPISAKFGDNVTSRSARMPWYTGATVLDALSSLVPTGPTTQELCFPIQDIYELDGEHVIVGRVESGRMSLGQRLLTLPDQTYCRIREIKKYGKTRPPEAGQGECIGIVLEGGDASTLKRGVVLTDSDDFHVSSRVKGRVFWMANEPCVVGDCYAICCTTQSVSGTVVRITSRAQVSISNEIVRQDSADRLAFGEVAEVEFKLDHPLVFQTRITSKLSIFAMKKDGVLMTGEGYFLD